VLGARVGAIKDVFYSLKNFFLLSSMQLILKRTKVFDYIHHAPYATRIKPLDKNFKVRSHSEGRDVMFYGYLPWEPASEVEFGWITRTTQSVNRRRSFS